MKFESEFIERVADANNIVDLISQHTSLKPTGGGLMGRCPFPDHQEKTPSFSVSETKQVYHCFGCHKSGNIFTFLRDFQGLSFPQAVEFLADRAGLPLPRTESDGPVDAFIAKKKKILEANRLALQFFRENLKRTSADHPARVYIQKRGLRGDTLETFQVGYASSEWDGLVNFLTNRGVSLEVAEEARLIKARTQGKTGHFDLFRDRLMFPILNAQGDVVAFGGRVISTGEPKYLNSPESPVFIKGKILYGLSETARYIRSLDSALVVEGYMDLVSLYQAGIKNVVATMGTALTADHGRILRRITQNVVVLFDGDAAGQEAAERSLPLLLAAQMHPKGLVLPNGMDPDDFVKERGAEELSQRIEKATDLFGLNLALWMKNYRGEASEKVQLIDRLKGLFRSIPDRRLQDLYLQEAAQKLGVHSPWLKQAIGAENFDPQRGDSVSQGYGDSRARSRSEQNLHGDKAIQTPLEEEKKFEVRLNGAPRAELQLLALALKSRANLQIIEAEKICESVSHGGVNSILTKCLEVYRQSPERFDRLISHLMTVVDEPRYLFHEDPLLREMSRDSRGKEGRNEVPRDDQGQSENESRLIFDEDVELKLLKDTAKRVRENFLRGQLKKLAQELKVDPSPEKMEKLMSLQKDLSLLNKEIPAQEVKFEG